ncbi:1-acyl-sn-glycerol-3-phosphate acyltransferase [Arthrobacter sp. PvP102]|uniref:lysophospholipid acyltransferase family protein n=1 Tax=unclassified Arthrobacter TaxID=235627 RepID=UPI001AE7F2A5|nr:MULTISPECIES: lysophospholipid acyltransferase family protein [unclassified Arthrobacter]MBP1234844.1 1-acyl-sn-glycerol-3-phosphate acyltransferase [Arthrobacter sp. PvP103]MBP1235802.1 1-acyl-sn-glycerol-3-phosphate acyltransferase [Arthrobacter sp. PvP102]
MAWRPKSNDRFYRAIVRTGLALRRLFGIRVIITGREHLPPPGPLNGSSRQVVPGEGAVVAITHFGYLDFAFAELLLWWNNRAEMRYLVTQGAADHWFAGPAISAAGHVVVPYGSGSGAYDTAVAKLREGEYIAILPEAGVSRSFTVRDCKTGAVRMAAEAGVPIIPVSVWGSHRLMTRHHGFSPLRAWRAPVRIHVGQPLLPADLPDPAHDAQPATDELMKILQAGIDAAIADFPLTPRPGAWWMPAHLGGGAPTEEERRRLDQAEGPRRAGGRKAQKAAARGRQKA